MKKSRMILISFLVIFFILFPTIPINIFCHNSTITVDNSKKDIIIIVNAISYDEEFTLLQFSMFFIVSIIVIILGLLGIWKPYISFFGLAIGLGVLITNYNIINEVDFLLSFMSISIIINISCLIIGLVRRV